MHLPYPFGDTKSRLMSPRSREARLAKYHVSARRPRRIPGTFTKERPSWFSVDMFWVGVLFVVALVFAGVIRENRSDVVQLSFAGQDDIDLRYVTADSLTKWMNVEREKVQRVIEYNNARIHFISMIVDPLPSFFSKPSLTTVYFAKVLFLYCILRFWLLHRNWRFNGLPTLTACVANFAMLWFSIADLEVAMYVSALWCWPVLVGMSVVLHRMLGDAAWKHETMVLELKPKAEDDINYFAYSDEPSSDMEALLKDFD